MSLIGIRWRGLVSRHKINGYNRLWKVTSWQYGKGSLGREEDNILVVIIEQRWDVILSSEFVEFITPMCKIRVMWKYSYDGILYNVKLFWDRCMNDVSNV